MLADASNENGSTRLPRFSSMLRRSSPGDNRLGVVFSERVRAPQQPIWPSCLPPCWADGRQTVHIVRADIPAQPSDRCRSAHRRQRTIHGLRL